MKYLTKIKEQQLNFVIAGYEDKLVYHENVDGELKAGKPISEDSLKSIFKVLNSKFIDFDTTYEFKNMIPKNVIKFSTDEIKIIWYTPSTIKKLFFSDEVPIETGCYPVPVLLWKLVNNSLYVYALDSIPKSFNSKLYNAPFFNTSSDGSICMGNARFTNDTNTNYEEIISLAETAFFNSYFTHSSNNNLLKENYVEYMNKSVSELKFKTKSLVKSNKLIKDIF